MNIIQQINNKASKALNNLQTFKEMEEEIHMNLNMIHGSGSKITDEGFRKVQDYNKELESELKAHFDIDSVEFAVKNQLPF